jgi:hypothetical protein
MDAKQYRQLVKAPSVGAILYQSFALSKELDDIHPEAYPPAAWPIRNVLCCVLEFAKRELTKILVPTNSYSYENDPGFIRTRELAKILHTIYVNIRFLRASSEEHCPLEIQVIISALIKRHFAMTPNMEPICLVRTQSVYNAQYYNPIADLLKPYRDFWDPEGDLGETKKTQIELLQILWGQWRAQLPEDVALNISVTAPGPMAIISFAGLDDHDPLLYPILLTHEAGHFIAFNHDIKLEERIKIRPLIQSLLKKRSVIDKEITLLEKMIYVCLHELLADLLAVRMMGLSFFFAQAEFFKTVRAWHEERLLIGIGYPENHVRLALVLAELLDKNPNWNMRRTLEECQEAHPTETGLLSTLLDEWESYLKAVNKTKKLSLVHTRNASSFSDFSDTIASQVLCDFLPHLIKLAEEIIPDEKCPRLTANFFRRIELLHERQPPNLTDDSADDFPEIMSAAWGYQMIHGEKREGKLLGKPENMFKEYDQTCDLVHEALKKLHKSK